MGDGNTYFTIVTIKRKKCMENAWEIVATRSCQVLPFLSLYLSCSKTNLILLNYFKKVAQILNVFSFCPKKLTFRKLGLPARQLTGSIVKNKQSLSIALGSNASIFNNTVTCHTVKGIERSCCCLYLIRFNV